MISAILLTTQLLLSAISSRRVSKGHCCLQDEASFVAGERAALLRAFRETLPSQQALGSLFHAVQHLTKRMDQEGHDVHQVRNPCLQNPHQAPKYKMDGKAQAIAERNAWKLANVCSLVKSVTRFPHELNFAATCA